MSDARAGYAHVLPIPTRWNDNDGYGHVNNVEYLAFFDTVINRWLIEEGGLDIAGGPTIGLCAESGCAYHAALVFPQVVDAALRVAHLGRTSVRYEVGLFAQGSDEPAGTGFFVHVFVERESRRPAPIEGRLRDALERLLLPGESQR
jgi:acyl-CoA thioester hydrolase